MKRILMFLSFLAISAIIFCQITPKKPVSAAEAAKLMGNRFVSVQEARSFWGHNIPGFMSSIDTSIRYTVSEVSDSSYWLLPVFNLSPETLKKIWGIDPDTKLIGHIQSGYILMRIQDYGDKKNSYEDTMELSPALEAIALLSGCHRFNDNMETMFASKDKYEDREGIKKRYCFLTSTEAGQGKEAFISNLPVTVSFGRFSQKKICYVAGKDEDGEEYFGMEIISPKHELRPSQWQTKFVTYLKRH